MEPDEHRAAEIDSWDQEDEHLRKTRIEQTARAQLAVLRLRLAARWGYWVPPENADGRWWTNEVTGEIIVWWEIGGCAYYHRDDQIYVEQRGGDDVVWTLLDAEGEPIEPWKQAQPVWWQDWMGN